ncbi:hypothetical protein BDB00DRAFT_802548 [Zychaea mexicana]|uniref:uncharacterized protein n=1 Tax=Zychaea mexicana TaxID=64656 RepID=UPI0022FED1DE|nr:uncharacterized protein BDB00DRAFT_802548 [Zychaea mexicana]KAI9497919.1 hypothetical protein BDB00DRAFT_802548 [Zychaea mexicana]
MKQLSPQNIQQFRDSGYTIIRHALSTEKVELLHEEADTLTNFILNEGYDLTAVLGCIIEPLTCGYLDPAESDEYKTDKHAYIARRNSVLENSAVSSIVLETVARWAAVLLGNPEQVFLMNEQFIVKPPHSAGASEFAWHQDSEYLDPRLQSHSTVACWIALDPVDEVNGTIMVSDLKNPAADPFVVRVPAGSIVFMSNKLRHKSTGNAGRLFRRVFMPQYSLNPLLSLEDDGDAKAIGLAIKCTF